VCDTESAASAAANTGSAAGDNAIMPPPGPARRYSVTAGSHSGGANAATLDSQKFVELSSSRSVSWCADAFFGEAGGGSALGRIRQELQQGVELVKHGRAGRPKRRWLWLDAEYTVVRWATSRDAMLVATNSSSKGKGRAWWANGRGGSPPQKAGAGVRRARGGDTPKSPSTPASPATKAGYVESPGGGGYYELKLADMSRIHCGMRNEHIGNSRSSKNAARRRFLLVRPLLLCFSCSSCSQHNVLLSHAR
jgi:hypothetical protein